MKKTKSINTLLAILLMSVNKGYKPLFKIIEEKSNLKINNIAPLSGGDINDVFLLNTSEGKKVVKVNSAIRFPGMFEAEMAGMKALKATNAIDAPKIIDIYTKGDYSCLLMEYRETGSKSSDFWTVFGKQMANLHKNTQPNFGFSDDNYIGSLPQHNNAHKNIVDFYIEERLQPQFRLATENGYSLGDTKKFCSKFSGDANRRYSFISNWPYRYNRLFLIMTKEKIFKMIKSFKKIAPAARFGGNQ